MHYIIAEVGVNHDGDLEHALQLIDLAKSCGADCVKFQHFRAYELADESLAQYELGIDGLGETREYAEVIGIDWLCTPFSINTLSELIDLGEKRVKLSHRHLPKLWAACAHWGVETWASAPSMTHADELVRICHPEVLLYVTTEYPTKTHLVDFGYYDAFRGMAPRLGYSDHTQGITKAVEAACYAEVIEKHFCGDFIGTLEEPWSADTASFAEMVERIRSLR